MDTANAQQPPYFQESFDTVARPALPAGWICGVTGKGSPRWSVESDATAPSPPNVLRQSGSGTFP
ncbi:MAG TPA: hypothetical protein VI139_08490, partial [Gemmatimonadales bacterium]